MSNEAYIESLIGQFEGVPQEAAVLTAASIFRLAVMDTVQDSGQAAWNWHIEAFTGDYSPAQFKEMLGVPPVGKTGDKRSQTGADAQIIMLQYERSLDFEVTTKDMDFTQVAVYNPIESDSDRVTDYEVNAFPTLDFGLRNLIDPALQEAEAEIALRYAGRVVIV